MSEIVRESAAGIVNSLSANRVHGRRCDNVLPQPIAKFVERIVGQVIVRQERQSHRMQLHDPQITHPVIGDNNKICPLLVSL